MPFPCFDLCLTAWRESETVFHGIVEGAAIFDCFAMGVFLDDLEVDAFLFGIVTIISFTDFDSRGWNAGRSLVADDCCSAGAWGYTAAGSGCSRMVLDGLIARARCLRMCAGDVGYYTHASACAAEMHSQVACSRFLQMRARLLQTAGAVGR